MSKVYVEGSFKTFTTGASNIPAGSAVKLASGLLVAATAGTDKIIGVVENAATATFPAAVHLRSAAGTCSGLAVGTVAVGDALTATTAGALIVTTTAGDQIVGYALEAATAGKYFEFMPSTGKY